MRITLRQQKIFELYWKEGIIPRGELTLADAVKLKSMEVVTIENGRYKINRKVFCEKTGMIDFNQKLNSGGKK